MTKFENCKSLNDIARQEFGKANYTNREKAKKLLFECGIDWRDWLESIKNSKRKFCLVCGKELNNEQTKFCSNSCAAKYNNSRRKLSLETRTKISDFLKNSEAHKKRCASPEYRKRLSDGLKKSEKMKKKQIE